jgi:DNA-directed RNA polymerase specialized sigma subunit
MPNDSKLEPEFATPFQSWKASPNPSTASQYLKAIDPVIQAGLSAYGGKNVNPMLHSRARRIALDVSQNYDPSQAKLKTYLMHHLQGLRRYSAQQTQIMAVPEQVALDQQHMAEAGNELSDRLGRDPSDRELADFTGMSIKRIGYVRKYKPGFATSQIAGMGRDGNDGEDSEIDPAVEQADPTMARIDLLYDDLDPVDQGIVESYFGRNGSPRLGISQIAKRLNLTPGAISQRAQRIQRKLDELDDLGVF